MHENCIDMVTRKDNSVHGHFASFVCMLCLKGYFQCQKLDYCVRREVPTVLMLRIMVFGDVICYVVGNLTYASTSRE